MKMFAPAPGFPLILQDANPTYLHPTRILELGSALSMQIDQAQVYGELTGLAQAAIDGRDVGLIACGPPGAGTSFTLCLDGETGNKHWRYVKIIEGL